MFREEMTSNIDEILCRTKNLKHKFNKKIQINKGLERLINNKNKKKSFKDEEIKYNDLSQFNPFLIFILQAPLVISNPLSIFSWIGEDRSQAMTMKLFDAHCHLQDPRILNKTPQLIATALDTGVVRFAVNGVSEVYNTYTIWYLIMII